MARLLFIIVASCLTSVFCSTGNFKVARKDFCDASQAVSDHDYFSNCHGGKIEGDRTVPHPNLTCTFKNDIVALFFKPKEDLRADCNIKSVFLPEKNKNYDEEVSVAGIGDGTSKCTLLFPGEFSPDTMVCSGVKEGGVMGKFHSLNNWTPNIPLFTVMDHGLKITTTCGKTTLTPVTHDASTSGSQTLQFHNESIQLCKAVEIRFFEGINKLTKINF